MKLKDDIQTSIARIETIIIRYRPADGLRSGASGKAKADRQEALDTVRQLAAVRKVLYEVLDLRALEDAQQQ